jgi:hypothetical protein
LRVAVYLEARDCLDGRRMFVPQHLNSAEINGWEEWRIVIRGVVLCAAGFVLLFLRCGVVLLRRNDDADADLEGDIRKGILYRVTTKQTVLRHSWQQMGAQKSGRADRTEEKELRCCWGLFRGGFNFWGFIRSDKTRSTLSPIDRRR